MGKSGFLSPVPLPFRHPVRRSLGDGGTALNTGVYYHKERKEREEKRTGNKSPVFLRRHWVAHISWKSRPQGRVDSIQKYKS